MCVCVSVCVYVCMSVYMSECVFVFGMGNTENITCDYCESKISGLS